MKAQSIAVVAAVGLASLGAHASGAAGGRQAGAPSDSQPGRQFVSSFDARRIADVLRSDLLPADLRTPAQFEATWPSWVSRRETEIAERLDRGDEDSVVMFLLFGVTFSNQPRYTFAAWASGNPPTGRAEDVVAADPSVLARVRDLVEGVASPGTSERLQFARRVLERQGISPGTSDGRREAERFIVSALRRTLTDYSEYFQERTVGATLFRHRGLSSDTSIHAAFAIDRALDALGRANRLHAGSVRRVAVIGPGLDFTDKQEGLDVYPPQTIQPFAAIDSLERLGLGSADTVRVAAYDINPRVGQHLEAALQRARTGRPYTLQLPQDEAQQWSTELRAYWRRLGDRIGDTASPGAPLPGVERVQLRAVNVRPAVVQRVVPYHLNIVLQRPDPLPESERFDLVIATNILVYYDVFDQSLALDNIASMLRPGGLLLTNNPVYELPVIPMRLVGETEVSYSAAGKDWVLWYLRE